MSFLKTRTILEKIDINRSSTMLILLFVMILGQF